MADINVERKKGGGIWPWVLGLALLALLLWGITQCGDDDAAEGTAVTDTLGAVTDTGMLNTTAPGAGAGMAGAPGAEAGAMLPVAQIVGTPDAAVGQTMSGQAQVTQVVSDRGFWVEDAGQRLFVVLGEAQAQEQRIVVQPGQTVQLTGVVRRGSASELPANFEAETKRVAEQQPAFLFVEPRQVMINGQPALQQ